MRQTTEMKALVITAGLLSGCSAMPKVTVSHYLPAASLAIAVTQTATCTGEGAPIIIDAVVMSATYLADKKVANAVDLAKLGSGVTKADATFEFFPDGRLKSVNSKQTGQAGAALGSFFKLVSSAAAATPTKDEIKEACKAITTLVGDGKALTIVHRGSSNFDSATVELRQTSVPSTLYNEKLKKIFGVLDATYSAGPATDLLAPLVDEDSEQGLTLRKTAPVTVTVTIDRDGMSGQYSEIILVPQKDKEYELPIQKGPWFGENSFELVLHDSGSVTKLRYGGGGDAGAVLGALADTHATFKGEPVSTSDQAKAVQAEADLIYQQQRLVLCQANPTVCPK